MLDLLIQFVFTYFVAWWLVLFMVLPVGIKRDDDVQAGNDAGAPKNALLKKRMFWTSVITFILTSAIVWLLHTVPLETLIGGSYWA